MEEYRARKTLNNMLKFHLLVEGLTPIVGGERTSAAYLFKFELSLFHIYITAALSESGGPVREAICGGPD